LKALRTHIQEARDRLAAVGIPREEAALDAELLARHALGWDRATYLARSGETAPAGFERPFGVAVERRARREPMAYILGVQEFWGRAFRVAPGVLIPRPETELLVEEGLAWVRGAWATTPGRPSDAPHIADIGTGSGCLAITLALELLAARVSATDVSARALVIARENASRLGARVAFHAGPILAGLAGPIDLIVSNPPYVTRAEYGVLQPEVHDYEPELALVGGDDGLDVVRQVVHAAAGVLAPDGALIMEIGYGQSDAVSDIVRGTAGLVLRGIRKDLQGVPRAVIAARGPTSALATSSG
jgi:release factor glutamine methyltransferase